MRASTPDASARAGARRRAGGPRGGRRLPRADARRDGEAAAAGRACPRCPKRFGRPAPAIRACGGARSSCRAQELQTRAIGAELRPDISLTATLSGRAGGAPPTQRRMPGRMRFAARRAQLGRRARPQLAALRPDRQRARSAPRARPRTFDARRSTSFASRSSASVQQAYVAVDVARDALPRCSTSRGGARQLRAGGRALPGRPRDQRRAGRRRGAAHRRRDPARARRLRLAKARAAFGRAIAEGL